MVNRLKELRNYLNLNQTDFAKYLGIKQNAYSTIESGKRPLADKYIKLICATFNVSEKWLRTGEGKIFISSPYEKELREILENLTPDYQQYILSTAKHLLELQRKLELQQKSLNPDQSDE